ncbi:alpha/beta fold hydrolase [Desnuesiella massiliensis]|uniref:alpha/beta fold hydrolase n=1 Tax=Desnuesiella massiliensis TaxID=1650662 RepID=UPI0006E139A0|nr:alpha/beta hydrolase [Desnuesiella massiliensis]
MAKVTLNDYELNYEIYGEGEPLIFLNGIMMSTLSWRPFVDFFKDYKLIFIDLIDQGSSSKGKEGYTQDIHVDMLEEFFNKMNVNKVHMLGISYGGEVAMKFALKYPEKLYSLILSNTTSYTNELMKDIEDIWAYAAGTYNGRIFFKATMPYIYSYKFYEENAKWLKDRENLLVNSLTPEWYDGFIRAIRSASTLNITEAIETIELPTLIIGADLDVITPLPYQEVINKKIKDSRFVVIKDSGHASMYEKPYEFAALVNGFLKNYDKKINII